MKIGKLEINDIADIKCPFCDSGLVLQDVQFRDISCEDYPSVLPFKPAEKIHIQLMCPERCFMDMMVEASIEELHVNVL